MVDKIGQQDINSLTINKFVAGFADEEFFFKKYLRQLSTGSTTIRYWQKTAGVLDSTDTTGITSSQIYNVAFGALPEIVQPTWTRNTANTKKYFDGSGVMANEDLKDNDVNAFATILRELLRAVENQVNVRIFNVLTENTLTGTTLSIPTNVSYSVAVGASWRASGADPVEDLLSASKVIASNNYSISGLVTLMGPQAYQNLLKYLISTKGSSIPQFASDRVKDGAVMNLVGHDIVVSNSVTANYVVTFIPNESAEWHTFEPLQ